MDKFFVIVVIAVCCMVAISPAESAPQVKNGAVTQRIDHVEDGVLLVMDEIQTLQTRVKDLEDENDKRNDEIELLKRRIDEVEMESTMRR